MIDWKQEPTKIEEDNQAAIYHSKATHMMRNLCHLELCTNKLDQRERQKRQQLRHRDQACPSINIYKANVADSRSVMK